MKIIFSRKGFDSSSGGFPSPIFPDGKLLSMPIPDRQSSITYTDIHWGEYNLGEIVVNLTKGKIKPDHFAHLDPDINEASLPRHKEWRPIFGQVGASQGHLRKQAVGAGDLFLFFGLFQNTFVDNGKFSFIPESFPRHVIWGWLQIESIHPVDEIDRTQFEWAIYHPHFHRAPNQSNTVYFAKRLLDLPGLDRNSIGGAGIFPEFSEKLQLTSPESPLSVWKLPQWMYPRSGKPALSYHGNLERWEEHDDEVLLQTVSRGQEFVLDSIYYPEAIQWVNKLFSNHVLRQIAKEIENVSA